MSASILPYTPELRRYLWDKGLREHPVLEELRNETSKLPNSVMQICPEQGALMSNLIKLISAKKAIEVGTYTGYSALAVALTLPKDGKLLACDISEEWTSIGKRAWKKAGVLNKIELAIGPAAETLDKKISDGEKDTYDFAFIDADKKNYKKYYEQCLKLVRPGGLIILDNVLWFGSVIDGTRQDEDTRAIRDINILISEDKRVTPSMIPVGDGLTLAVIN